MKRLQHLFATSLMVLTALSLSACRANLGNLFDLW